MLQSAFQDHFASLPNVSRPRSQFRRVSRHKHTFDEGYLVPFYVDDVVPGDTFNVKASAFARLATPIFPVMDNMYLEMFWFYVPNRILWTNFVKQHGERATPSASVSYTTPEITCSGVTPTVGSLWDNFGLPMTGVTYLDNISALPFRAYNKIWSDWFRDEDVDDTLPNSTGDGPDAYTDYTLQRVRKYKDYFTTARTAPQKGTAVSIPLGTTATVKTNASELFTGAQPKLRLRETATGGQIVGPYLLAIDSNSSLSRMTVSSGSDSDDLYPTNLYADLSSATAATLNQLRDAITTQQMYELDMRGGYRYVEMVNNHYGVTVPDFRVQRPEFLGYSRTPINIHPVPQMSETTGSTAQGHLAAFGTASGGSGFVKSFVEHGYVIGLVTVRSDLSYQECVDRHWSRQTRLDYYYPVFANLGEQAILNQEVRNNNAAATGNTGVFGYQERWAEYRFKTSKITGLFRSSAASNIDEWHLAQELTYPVTLNGTFLQEDAPVDRVIATPSEPHFIFDSYVENLSARPMPVYSVPGLLRI